MQEKRYQKPINIQQILQNSDYATVMQKGLFINELNLFLQKIIPKQFNQLYRLSNFSEDSLIIEVQNAMVRQALLFEQSKIIAQIKQTYPEIKQLKFKINPELSRLAC